MPRGLESFTTEHEGSDGHHTWQTRMETLYFNLIVTIGSTGEQEEEPILHYKNCEYIEKQKFSDLFVPARLATPCDGIIHNVISHEKERLHL